MDNYSFIPAIKFDHSWFDVPTTNGCLLRIRNDLKTYCPEGIFPFNAAHIKRPDRNNHHAINGAVNGRRILAQDY